MNKTATGTGTTPLFPPQDFQAYTHQTGLQGWAFGVLNKVLSVFEDRGEAREIILYSINSMLFYAATLLVCLAVWRAWGPLSALTWLCAVVFAPPGRSAA